MSIVHLPPHLFHAYARYKRGTYQITDWLVKECPAAPFVSRGTTCELLWLVDTVKSQGCVIPLWLLRSLEEIIRLRSKVTSWFESLSGTNSSTEAHRYFTDTLRIAYRGLSQNVELNNSCASSRLPTEPLVNCYTCLELEEDLCAEHLVHEEHCQEQFPYLHDNVHDCSDPHEHPHDAVGDFMAIASYTLASGSSSVQRLLIS